MNKWKLKSRGRHGHLTEIMDNEKEYLTNDLVDKLNELEEEVEHWKKEFYQIWYWEFCGSDTSKIEMFEKIFNKPFTDEEFHEIVWR